VKSHAGSVFFVLLTLGARAPAQSSNLAQSSNPAQASEAAKAASLVSGTSVGEDADTRGNAMRAYEAALAKLKLAPTIPLSAARLREDLGPIEEKIGTGRRDEAIADLVYIVESIRFDPFKDSDEGRACVYWLGDALGRGGAYQPARGYLKNLLDPNKADIWYRRAVHSLVDLALQSDEPRPILVDLEGVGPAAPDELGGDVQYLTGRVAEREGKPDAAAAAYAKVSERSRFWAQATYRAGMIAVENRDFKQGEALFCKVADPKQTPKKAAVFGGADFFRVRDLARLGLGRVAHEQYRFDDARYYYYLVPHDSDDLPEALYETATSRYEAKDYAGARESIDELARLKVEHPYQDEAYILDAYIDLATCHFPAADQKLNAFLVRYDPVRDAARRLTEDPAAVAKLVAAVRSNSDPASAGLGVPEETARALGALLRVDASYGRVSGRLAELDQQQSGLRNAMADLDRMTERLASPAALRPQSSVGLGPSDPDKALRIEGQVAELKRLLREAERVANSKQTRELNALYQQLEALELQARAARAALLLPTTRSSVNSQDLPSLLAADRERASALYNEAQKLRSDVQGEQLSLATDALLRLDRRLSRLLRRARLGRIETVLGKKRALEIEVEALSQGLLPQTIVDSLDAARYLGDDEEYWPLEGEDWADEYVGGENLK
jgi:hypothetical protein